MLFPGLKRWAEERGWKTGKMCVYGEYSGYVFTVFDVKGYKAFVSVLPNLTQAQGQRIIEFLRANKKRLKVWQFGLDDNVLTVKSREMWRSMNGKEMDSLLKGVTGFLMTEGIQGREYCAVCGSRGGHDLVFFNDIVMTMCSECFDESQSDIEEMDREFKAEDKNYIKGIIGAALGGLIATIPWVLVGVYLELYASILGYLIGYASLKGYNLLNGKIGRATKWIIGINTVLCVFIAELVTLAIFMIQDGAPVSLENYIIAFTHPELSGMVLKDIGIGLVMAFLGVSSIFRKLKNHMDTSVPKIRKA